MSHGRPEKLGPPNLGKGRRLTVGEAIACNLSRAAIILRTAELDLMILVPENSQRYRLLDGTEHDFYERNLRDFWKNGNKL